MGMIKEAVSDFSEDDAMTLAGAMAFYAALSLAPLILLLIWMGGLLGTGTQEQLISQVKSYAGEQAGQSIQTVVNNAGDSPQIGTFAGVIAIVTTLLAATGVFAQLQYAMNRIWEVPPTASGIGGWLRKRALSLLMILIIGAVLIASLILTAVFSAVAGEGATSLPGGAYLWTGIHWVVSLLVFTFVFAAIFKVLPDARITWRSTWVGASITAVLFQVGKYLVGLYLAHSSAANAYGAAGSLLVLLVWLYYSAVIFFFGAELTQVWARRYGRGIRADHSPDERPWATA